MTLLTILAGIALPYWGELTRWVPDDYAYFLRWGHQAQSGIWAYRYPLATDLWIFLPLSLLPSWFALVWVAAPFIFTLNIIGRRGVVLWLSYSMLFHASVGQIDGWFLIPLYYLFTRRGTLAGISAALITLKPQLALLPVSFVIYRWFKEHDHKSLLFFFGTMSLLYIPAFLLDPGWIGKSFLEMQVRASESIQKTRGATLWAWWWHGDWTVWILPLVLILIAILLISAFRFKWKQAQAVHLLGLLLVPVFYSVSFVTITPTLRNSMRHLIAITVVSWISVVVDTLANGWGGAYAIIPITALILLVCDPYQSPTLPSPTIQTARSITGSAENRRS